MPSRAQAAPMVDCYDGFQPGSGLGHLLPQLEDGEGAFCLLKPAVLT